MMLLALISWWYTAGWAGLISGAVSRSSRLLETFSVSLLLGSLFDPFRQISAGGSRGTSFDAQLRAFGDRLFSRLFGAVVRSIFILIGFTASGAAFVGSLVMLVVWPFIPLSPFIGVALAVMKVTL
jgi:hypothetical protein